MKFIFFLLIFISALSVKAQDERQFRELFSSELSGDVKKGLSKDYRFIANTPIYKFDLDSDHRQESIFYEIKDGESWLHFLDYGLNRVKSFKFDTNGNGAKIYKIRIKNISASTLVLVVHFYEGLIDYTELNSTARLYFITIDKNDLKSLSMFKGPIFWQEKRTAQKHYHQRPNHLSFSDLNKNGTKEIIVKQGLSSSVFMYNGEGKWLRF